MLRISFPLHNLCQIPHKPNYLAFIKKLINFPLVPKLLLGKSQVAPGFAGFWAKQGFVTKKVPQRELGNQKMWVRAG